jgi:tetratricopeptide (TPR) repeat protein
MILSILIAASAAASKPPGAPNVVALTFDQCVALAKTDTAKAIAAAEAWRAAGGGLAARQCLGLAYVTAERWGPAALAFEQAARDAEIQRDGRAANLWVQSGNASLAGDDSAKAKMAFDRAIALPTLSDPMRGEALMDRARAEVGSNDVSAARADLDAALKLVPQDPMGWLLSATLARRQNDLARAGTDIIEALRLAPDDAAVAYEQGNIAFEEGNAGSAKGAWQRAIDIDTKVGRPGDIAISARMAIAKLETGAAPEQ